MVDESEFKAFGGYRRYLKALVPGVGPGPVAKALGFRTDRVIRDCKRLGVPLSERQRGLSLTRVEMGPDVDVVTEEIVRLRDEEGLGWIAIGTRVGLCVETCRRKHKEARDGQLPAGDLERGPEGAVEPGE